ncbi:MAG: cupin domain-containing protein [Flavobacteriales bacterium]
MQRTIVNPVIKDSVTFIQSAEESGGKVTEAEITLSPGGGNPLHYHRSYSETFTALNGELVVGLGKKGTRMLKPGESYTVAPMVIHRFFNAGKEEIKFNVKVTPGQTGLEQSLRIVYGLATDGLTNKDPIPKNLKHMAVVVCMSDMNIPGPMSVLYPLLKYMAKRAKASGAEQQLIDRYCV